MSLDQILDIRTLLVERINDLQRRVDELESQQQMTIVMRNEPGDLPNGKTGQIVINNVDNTTKLWADGAWSEIASW